MQKKKKPAVFLDRDGVLVREKGYIASVEELEIFPFAKECVRKIHEKGYHAIVITNQSGIARGLFTEDTLFQMNRFLMEETDVDAVYYCPHYPKGKIEPFCRECSCRKPQTGMFMQAERDFSLDFTHSYMIGDRAGDVLAGLNAGVKTVLLESGYGTKRLEFPVKADYVLPDLRDVLDFIPQIL